MRIIIACVLCYLAVTTFAADDHRAKKKDDRGKRQLEYQITHPYSTYHLERRISTGPQVQGSYPPQYYPRPYRKGRPQSYPIPPYAVQMEPLVHYSQRDPLYDTNILSLDIHNDDLLTENNYITQEEAERRGTIHIHRPPKIIEKPVYIKEPEPIIEIIIKESNVSLPAPPPPSQPPKKKKEQVQVFFVKYKKNPHGTGKDAIIYDKPVPAISPKLPEDEEEEVIEQNPYNYHQDEVTAYPPPSTTLKTIIRPDSETYESPSGIKVTFGKEGFDYDKRASKPEDFVPPESPPSVSQPQPQGRQLSSFSNAYFKPPSGASFQSFPPQQNFRSDQTRQRQTFRPVSFPSSSNYKSFGRQTPQFQQPPKFQPQPNFQNPPPPFIKTSPPFNFPVHQQQTINLSQSHLQPQSLPPQQFSHTVAHPPPARFQSARPHIREPVPYTPFESFRTHQPEKTQSSLPVQHSPIQFRPETHFPTLQQLPSSEQSINFNRPRFSQPLPKPEFPQRNLQKPQPQLQFDRQPPLNYQHQQFSQNIQNQPPVNIQHESQVNYQQQNAHSIQNQPPSNIQNRLPSRINQNQPPQNKFVLLSHPSSSERPPHTFQQQNIQFNRQQSLNNNLHNHVQNIVPPGGELIQSVPKYEQHISSVELSSNNQQQQQQQQQHQHLPQPQEQKQHSSQNSTPQLQQKVIEQFNSQEQQDVIQQNILEQQRRIIEQQRREEQLRQYYLQQQQFQQNQQQQQIHQQQIQQQRERDQQAFNNNEEVVITSPSPSTVYQTRKGQFENTTPRYFIQSSTNRPSFISTTTTTTTETSTPSTTTKDPKILEAQLPDEVPEELRQQLLSSGILNNADISVLDYDKQGDIPLSALPPDQLANFFSAGGAAQIAGSEPVASVVNRDGSPVADKLVRQSDDAELESAASEVEEVRVSPDLTTKSKIPPSAVDLKVVHYDPATDKGQQVQESYTQGESVRQVSPVVLNDESYTRYLPLKVNGSQFPIPNVPELKGKKISSVVVLAPVTYDFSSDRKTREASKSSDDIEFIEGTALKTLLVDPTLENYRTFLEAENKTASDKQAVILLVADSSESTNKEREIFMYDVGTGTVSKLSGELSSAFVDAAEANSSDNIEEAAASNIIETRIPYHEEKGIETNYIPKDLDGAASEFEDTKIPIIDPTQDEDMETDASENLESFMDISGHSVGDLSGSANEINNPVESIRTNLKTGLT